MALPAQLQNRFLPKEPTRQAGFELDRQVELLLALSRGLKQPKSQALSLPAARRLFDLQATLMVRPAPRIARVFEEKIHEGLWVRIYEPIRAARPLPALVYYHGGGFVLGGFDTHDAPCRRLAEETGSIVVSVDYRLAPEHVFPAAVEDALASFRWLVSHAGRLGIDARRVGVGGDSAGGNLAAVVALETRADAVRPKAQILVYPAVDFTLASPSIESLKSGYFLEKSTIEWFRERYLASASRLDGRASPLLREDLRGAPPAVLHVAGFDPLRDEGLAYAERLKASGVPVVARTFGSLFHGYLNATRLRAADLAVARLSEDTRSALSAESAA